MSSLTIGTRTSKLALWQTRHIMELLQAIWPDLDCRLRTFVTQGDKTLEKPLPEIGGKGLFTAELERALHHGEIDLAVHSLKDLPVENAPGLTLGAILGRTQGAAGKSFDVGDALVARNGWTLASLPPGAVVGASSMRRQAQLLALRPDLTVKSIRGNVDTRVRKVLDGEYGEYDATLLAVAGLQRLGLTATITERLALDVMLPAPGQGALAVQCRADDVRTLEMLATLDDPSVRAAVTAERCFLHELGGGCSAPVAAYAEMRERPGDSNSMELYMQALAATPDGRLVVRVNGRGGNPYELGKYLAEKALRQFREGGENVSFLRPLPSKPLLGKRIVVTRAENQSQEFSDKLRQLGAVVIEIPAIRIEPAEDMGPLLEAIHQLAGYGWAIFTSVNGVEIFWEQLGNAGLDAGLFQGVRTAAIGPATAGALRERGLEPDFMPEKFTGEEIVAGLGDVSGLRVLLPRGELARKNLAELLTAWGAIVDEVVIYRTLPAEIHPSALAELQRGVHVITFTSGSTARNFVTAIQASGQLPALFDNTLIACIGPVSADEARQLGLEVGLVAGEHTTDGLVQALSSHFGF